MAWRGPLKLSRPQISRSWRQRKLHHVHWHAHLCPFHRHFDQTRWHHDILTDISEDSTTCYPPKPPPTFKHDNLDELLLQRWWRPLTSLSSPRAGHSRPGPHSCRCQSQCSWERCRRSRSCSAHRRCIEEQLDHVSPPLEGGFQAFLLLPHLGADVPPAGDRSPAKCLVNSNLNLETMLPVWCTKLGDGISTFRGGPTRQQDKLCCQLKPGHF